MWEHGELLLVSVALAGSGLGDLLISGVLKHLKKKLAVGFMAVLIIFSATWIFADISAGWQLNQAQMDSDGISFTSWVIFGCAVLTGGCCIALSEG